MNHLREFLAEPASVVTAGIGVLEDALRAQGVVVEPVAWRPPVEGTADALAALAADERTAAANAEAVGRLLATRPLLVDVLPAREAFPDLGPQTFLHAGPPIDWDSASGPLRGALIGAVLYEGLAPDPDAAVTLLEAGGVELAPCHAHGAVGPMAGVVTPSMPVHLLVDEHGGGSARCTLNEGLGKVLRYGAYAPEVIDRLRWMERVLGPLFRAALRRHGPLDVRALAAQALQMGDELHNRNRAATSLYLRELAGDLVEAAGDAGLSTTDAADALRFVHGNDHFFLNVIMPACKLAADAARDLAGSTLVVAMARNGTEFGVQTAGTGDAWFTAPASVPDGLYLGAYTAADANPDIGDSTITETAGLGGFAMAAAPAIVRFVGGDVGDATAATLAMDAITLAEHPAYQIPGLGFRGTPTGIDAALVVRTGVVPAVNTGIAGRVAGTGQVGAGLVSPPIACFADAVRAVAATANAAPHVASAQTAAGEPA